MQLVYSVLLLEAKICRRWAASKSHQLANGYKTNLSNQATPPIYAII